MSKRVLAAVALAAMVALAGCAGQQEFASGQRLYELHQYDEAVKSLERASSLAPGNKEYASLLERAKKDAARYEYQRGLAFYEKRQLDSAIAAFDKARRYDPAFAAAAESYESARKRKEAVQAILSDIPRLLRDGKPDEALARLAEVDAYRTMMPEIDDLRSQALMDSTVAHTKQGVLALKNGNLDEAAKEFKVALNRTPNYAPAAQGLAQTEKETAAMRLVAEGRDLLARRDYAGAYARFRQAQRISPGNKAALAALIEAGGAWARALYNEGRALEEAGGFDNLAEALRRYERAGTLTERFEDLDDRVAALKRVLAPEFLKRALQYEELGTEYLGLALVNYQMSLYADPSQTEVSRKVAEVKDAFDKRRAFQVSIQATDQTSTAASFSKELAQTLKQLVIASGISDLYIVAPEALGAMSASTAPARGLPGRRMSIFVSLVSEGVVTEGQNSPKLTRSRYRLGTRFVPNPAFMAARQLLAKAEARETDVSQDLQRALDDLNRAQTPEERASAQSQVEFERQRFFDAQDAATAARTILAATPEDVEEEIFQPYDYKVYSVAMQAKVEVSLEVTDVDTTAIKSVEVISGTADAENTYNEGVQATDSQGVKAKAPEIPSESELLAKARAAATTNAVAWLKGAVTRLSTQYYQRGKDLSAVGNAEGASEYFYAFYLSTPDKDSPEAREAIDYVRTHTHLVTPEERRQPDAPAK